MQRHSILIHVPAFLHASVFCSRVALRGRIDTRARDINSIRTWEPSCLHSDANTLSHRRYNVSCLNRAVDAPARDAPDGVTQSGYLSGHVNLSLHFFLLIINLIRSLILCAVMSTGSDARWVQFTCGNFVHVPAWNYVMHRVRETSGPEFSR